jgi:hypothetical protein
MTNKIQHILDLSLDIMSLVEDNLIEPYKLTEQKHNDCMKHLISKFLYPPPLIKEMAIELLGCYYGQLKYVPEHFDIYDKEDVIVFSTPKLWRWEGDDGMDDRTEYILNDEKAPSYYGWRLKYIFPEYVLPVLETYMNLDKPYEDGKLTARDWEGLMQSARFI